MYMYFPIVKSYHVRYYITAVCLSPPCIVIKVTTADRQLTARIMCIELYSAQLWFQLCAATRVTWPFKHSLEGTAALR
jgi:hypothetical protein